MKEVKSLIEEIITKKYDNLEFLKVETEKDIDEGYVGQKYKYFYRIFDLEFTVNLTFDLHRKFLNQVSIYVSDKNGCRYDNEKCFYAKQKEYDIDELIVQLSDDAESIYLQIIEPSEIEKNIIEFLQNLQKTMRNYQGYYNDLINLINGNLI